MIVFAVVKGNNFEELQIHFGFPFTCKFLTVKEN